MDGNGNRLTLSADAEGRARYCINGGDWQATDYQLTDGWNKTRVVFGAGKPLEFWMAPQRAGTHPKEQWKLIGIAIHSSQERETDFKQELGLRLSGFRRIEVGRNPDSSADFLFDDLFVITNKHTARQMADGGGIGERRHILPGEDELDERLLNRDWPVIKAILKEKGLLEDE